MNVQMALTFELPERRRTLPEPEVFSVDLDIDSTVIKQARALGELLGHRPEGVAT